MYFAFQVFHLVDFSLPFLALIFFPCVVHACVSSFAGIVYDLLIEQAGRGLGGSLETKAAFQLPGLISPSSAPFR